MAQVQIQSVSHRHEAIADWLLANPHEKNLEKLSLWLNVSRPWLSIVMRSDAFREYWAWRRRPVNQLIVDRIVDQQLNVAEKALGKMSEILSEDEVSPSFVLESAKSVCKMLGFSPRPGGAPVITTEQERTREVTRSVGRDILERARETVRHVTRVEGAGNVPALPSPEA